MKTIFYSLSVTLIVLSFSGQALALPYLFSVDRFEVSGNLVGSAYDEFDNANLSPQWIIDSGTVTESGGQATFTNPGLLDPFIMGDYFVTSETSQIASDHNDPSFHVQDTFGNFTGTSTWMPFLPLENQWNGMQADIDFADGSQLELIRLTLFNASPEMADAFGDIPTGLGISFGRFLDPSNIEHSAVSIDEADITGDILFRLMFDDTTNMFNGAYSLDGGTSFQDPFPSIQSSMGGKGVFSDWELEGGTFTFERQVVPEPASLLLLGTGLMGMFGLRKKRI